MSVHLKHDDFYRNHRNRIKNAKSVVNSNPPMRKHLVTEEQAQLSFVQLMASLNGPTSVRTFTKSPNLLTERQHSNLLAKRAKTQLNLKKTNDNAKTESNLLVTVRSENLRAKKSISHIPDQVIRRYENLFKPNNPFVLPRLLRPRVYFDIFYKSKRCLGQLVVQLYTEACPEVVLEFVRTCTEKSAKYINLNRSLTPLWIEGELLLANNKSLTSPNIEHDTNVLDHGLSGGILSFPSRYIRGSKRHSLSFTISFKPLSVLNGKRIAFGKVCRGYSILDTIQNLGIPNGQPMKELNIVSCGMAK